MWRAFPFQVRDELGCRGKGQKRSGTLLCCVLLGEKEAVGSLSSSPTTGGPKQTEVEARSRHSCHSVYCKEWPQLCNFCTALLFCWLSAYLDLNHLHMRMWVLFLPAAAGRRGRSLSTWCCCCWNLNTAYKHAAFAHIQTHTGSSSVYTQTHIYLSYK